MRSRLAFSFVLGSSLLAVACGAGNGATAGAEGGSSTTNPTGAAGGTGTGGSSTGGAGTGGSSAGGASNGGSSTGGASNGGSSNGGAGGGDCLDGTADCNGDPADGCETILQIDVNNCGACGVVCEGGAGVPPTCAVGKCKLDCPLGAGDCNMNPNDGCEANLLEDSQNCGACGLACMGSPCIEGACACAAETTQANLVQLDLFFMLDKSGSMTETVQGGGTRWQAVTSALNSFFTDPANAGLGAGIQYFPITGASNCSPTCVTNADCGAYGPCFLGICFACVPGGSDSCAPADYAVAQVPIAPLGPAQATALANSINGQTVSGNTPTGPALQGALSHAQNWAIAHPSHNVVVVLATDGDPTECTPSDIPGIANIAASVANGSPPVKTFVIGVGASLANLNAIAASGGTGSAFIVDGNANVAQEFKAALDAIQSSALGCEYTIPQPGMGMLDYDKVNVQYTPGGGSPQVIPNVPDAASCDPATGGWYYDNPMSPTKIILCGSTCGPIELDPAGKIDILLGCATEHV